MASKSLSFILGLFLLVAGTLSNPEITRAAGAVLEHKPPAQVYQGVPFRLEARPLVPVKRLVLHISVAAAEASLPMRFVNKQFSLDVPGKLTKDRRGPITYYFEAVDQTGQATRVYDPAGNPYQTRIVPQPEAFLLYPTGGKATMDAFTITIALNEAFAMAPVDSFQVTFAGQDVRDEMTCSGGQISFPVGPGLHNGSYTVKLETAGIPGWKKLKKSWTFTLRLAPTEPMESAGPLTIKVSAAQNPADLGRPDLGWPATASLNWDGKLLGVAVGGITPDLSPLTLSDPTPLTLSDTSLFGMQARLDLGRLGGRLILGQSAAGEAFLTYPQLTLAVGLNLGMFSVNLAAVVEDQAFTPMYDPARQSYVASLGCGFGRSELGQLGGMAEIAYALSFPRAVGTVDWTQVNVLAGQAGATEAVKLLSTLEPLFHYFPLPYVDPLDQSTWPILAPAYRVAAWVPLDRAVTRLDFSLLGEDFLSLGSPLFPGTTAVLMVALDPERAATKPFTYDPGPVYSNPTGALSTYGMHFTGLGFTLFGDPGRIGLDYFATEWKTGTSDYETSRTVRLLVGYYTYVDLDLILEGSINSNTSGDFRHYGLEVTATRKIGHLTLALAAGAHQAGEILPDPGYGLGLNLKYDSDRGLILTLDLRYGDPYEFQADPMALRAVAGLCLNF